LSFCATAPYGLERSKETDPMHMTSTTLASSLKSQLDEIDQKTKSGVYSGFYESRLKIEIGMWQKGRVVSDFRGVNSEVSYAELARQTSRSDKSLKEWNDLYEKYRDFDWFLKEHAEPVAKAWTRKALSPTHLLSAALIAPHLLPAMFEEDRWAESFLKLLNERIDALSKPDAFENDDAWFEAFFHNLVTHNEWAWLRYKIDVCTTEDISQLVLLIRILTELGQLYAEFRFYAERRAGELLNALSAEDKALVLKEACEQ